jgi:hypothetical protein
MKRLFVFLVLAFALCSIIVSKTWAGEREDNLVSLAMSGNVDGVRNLLDQGVDVNAKDRKYNCTALVGTIWFYALAPGGNYMGVVQLLLARGADINKVGYGYTPLSIAAMQGHADIVRILIDKGADVNKKDENGGGQTPLMRANELLEKGKATGLDKSFHILYTPLTPEEIERCTNVVRMLEAAGAK